VRETAFAVFHGINDMERNVFADEIASLITGLRLQEGLATSSGC
jgi:hypothetical protein